MRRQRARTRGDRLVCAMCCVASQLNQHCHAASLCVWRQPCADEDLNLPYLQPAQKTCAALNPRCSVVRTTAEGQAAHKPDEYWCIPSGLTQSSAAPRQCPQGDETGPRPLQRLVRLVAVGRMRGQRARTRGTSLVCAMCCDASKFNKQCHAASLCVWRQPCADEDLNLTHCTLRDCDATTQTACLIGSHDCRRTGGPQAR